MIAFLRGLIFEDYWLKLFSLALAVLVWLTVTFASQGDAPTEDRVLSRLPITVVSETEDVRNFKVSPSEAQVRVRGDARTIQKLQSKQIRVTVDLTGVTTAPEHRKRVEVSAPPGVAYLRVVPEEVQVIFPPDW
ncbi:MAG TPA: CdaR family protein [Verrucomicrobiota bacterium]|jgi:YbbR domain-containing protein|nr:CdaR family protein [Verrucomicrobiota bacterium]HQL79479.1 CdaR family protein [Verrucomicrobiota bacterium]